MVSNDTMQEATGILFQTGVLLDLSIGRWGAIKKMKAGDMLLEGVDEDLIYMGHKRLLPKSDMAALVSLEGKARTSVDKRSIYFPIAGARFVYQKTLPDLLETLKKLKAQWDEEVETLVSNYPQLKDQQLELLHAQALKLMEHRRERLQLQRANGALSEEDFLKEGEKLLTWMDEQVEKNQSHYLDQDALRSRFRFSWRIFKISSVAADEMTALEADELASAQKQLKQDMQAWVKEAATAMHQALGQAASQARGILQKHGKVTQKNLKPLFDAFDTFKAIDFTGASTFHAHVDAIKQKYMPGGGANFESMAESINATGFAQSEFDSLLSTISDLAVQDVAQKAGMDAIGGVGDFRRLVEL